MSKWSATWTYIVQFHSMVIHNLTRRYPWGIQRLVSTYSNCNPVLGSQNWKCQDLPKFQFSRVFLDKSRTPLVQNSKCQDLANFSFRGGGGGGYSWPGKNRVFLPKWAKICHASHILEGLASQTVSHIQYVETNWRNRSLKYKGIIFSPRQAPVRQLHADMSFQQNFSFEE